MGAARAARLEAAPRVQGGMRRVERHDGRVELGTARGVDEVARQGQASGTGGFSGSPRPDSGAHAAGALWPWAADSVSENLGFACRSFTLESRGETHM